MSILSDLGRSLTGNVESAYITVHDMRESPALSGGMLAAAVAGALLGDNSEGLPGGKNRRFKVQYNPAELQISAYVYTVSKTDTAKPASDKSAKTTQDSVVPPTIDLRMSLIFDQMNIADSFMLDKFSVPSTPSGIKNTVSMVAGALGKKWSVQKEVEGFIAALRNPLTRYVTFSWANFSFTGSVNAVSAQYTMFSTTGHPVRANVNLGIRQLMNKKVLDGWYRDFEKAFAFDPLKQIAKTAQQVTNALNLNI